ncbi:MAG TPA: carboxypeptidase-like regulatory domain-containing protein [Pyrinomonadaceae bacterium]|nr:carboxypeptidase-like regulatory domain-containing protein [Pyrinomonadaceae bacterium]
MERFIATLTTRNYIPKLLTTNAASKRPAPARVARDTKLIEGIPTLGLLLVFLLVPVSIFAQATSSTSSVTGIITDTTGSVIPGAEVKLTNTRTSSELVTKTDDGGVYRFSQVQPSEGYLLSVTSPGFQTLELGNIALRVGTVETHNLQLSPGQVTESVLIQDQGGATLNTTDASIGNVIDTRRMAELPVQFRGSPAALMGLQPGVIGDNVGTGATNRVGSVTGSRADQGNITVDGIDANDQATGQAFATTGNAPIDAIQEFRTTSANPAASEGRSSGGQIQLITKSGSNQFHGSLREFNRTALTAANSFFNNRNGVERPQLTRNQFGGSLGGPLYLPRFGEGGPSVMGGKDKLFFFFDYEGRRDARGISYLRIVPLAHVRAGGLAYLNNTAGCTTDARLNTAPQCITTLSSAQVRALDPLLVGVNPNLLSFINQRYPTANDLTAGDGINTGGFRFNAPSRRADNNYTGRVDWKITDQQRMFGRVSKISALQTDTVNATSVAQQFPGDPETSQISTGDYAWVVGHNWVPTPSVVNNITVGLTKSILGFPNNFDPSFPQSYSFGLITDPYASFATQDRTVPVWTFRDDLSWTAGSHSFQFGGSVKTIDQQTKLVSDFNYPLVGLGGNLTGFGTGVTGTSLRPANIGNGAVQRENYDTAFSFLLGTIPSVSTLFNYDSAGVVQPLGTGKARDWRYDEYEFYAQDSWKMRNDLTLTYGVRWHIYPAPYERNGAQSIQNVDYESLINLRIANGAAGIAGPSSEPFLVYELGGKANDARPFYANDWNNFAPRLSFAYNPSVQSGWLGKLLGDRKTVIRGGATMTYDRPGGGITFLQDQNSHIFDTFITTNLPVPNARIALLTMPRFVDVNTVPLTNTAPAVTVPFTPFVAGGEGFGTATQQTNYAVDPNFKVPYSFQYSFGFQRELPGNFILEASYVGRQGRKLFTLADAAQIIDFKDQASGQFMIAAFNNLQSQIESGGPITAIPWFENQMGPTVLANYGATCGAFGLGSNCTQLVANFLNHLIVIGDTADSIQALYANALIRPNVGLSSQFGTNAFVTNKGSSSYNGLLVSLRKRFSQGMQFDVNYTFSNSIDNQSTVVNTTTSGGLICDVTNLRVCRGPSDFDIRHLFNVNGIFELPVGRGRAFASDAPGWLDTIIGGWQVSGIFTARSGLPFSLATVSWPRSFIFDGANGVPAVISGNAAALRASIHDAPGGTIQFFADPAAALAAVEYPRHGEIGNRNTLRSTPFWNLDTAVLKNFKLPWSENQRIQLRWEAFNAFNHHVFGLPDRDIGSTTFGQVTTSQSVERVMQFGIRWDF